MLLFAVIDSGVEQRCVKQPKIDEQLFVRIGNGENEAFCELYQLTERIVYAFTLSILRNPHDTQDVVQDTYLKVRAAAHLYVPQGKPLAWLFTIAKNLCKNRLRQVKSAGFGDDIPEDDIRFSYVEDREDRLVLTAALNILSEDERQVILLHLVSGLRHNEIAAQLGQPLSTVLSRYYRALEKLKRHLIVQGVFEG